MYFDGKITSRLCAGWSAIYLITKRRLPPPLTFKIKKINRGFDCRGYILCALPLTPSANSRRCEVTARHDDGSAVYEWQSREIEIKKKENATVIWANDDESRMYYISIYLFARTLYCIQYTMFYILYDI